ncbi:hypothetical protein G6549_00450 [Bacillus sp. MM2020_1]|nr:hypothetical protein [Bacillus sp. MM2020_1]
MVDQEGQGIVTITRKGPLQGVRVFYFYKNWLPKRAAILLLVVSALEVKREKANGR